MPIYMKIDSIPGSSTDANFPNQIELNSFQWGAGIACTHAQGGDRTIGTASVSDVVGAKVTDKSTEKLFKSLLQGDSVGKATVSFVASIKNTSVAYLTIELEEVIVSGWSMSSGGDSPTESVTLNFTKFNWTYQSRDESQSSQQTRLGYSLIKNQVV